MKTKDLMIGDFVTFKDCQNNEAPTIVKIEGLGYQERGGAEEALVTIDGDAAFDLVEINEEFVGIPLTPEILEKNGMKVFEHRNPWQEAKNLIKKWYSKDGKFYVSYYRVGAAFTYTIGNGVSRICSIEYVHELQHALHILRIEKEIKL